MLEQVKANLGITGSYQDTTIQGYINEVKEFLMDGGVSKEIVDDIITDDMDDKAKEHISLLEEGYVVDSREKTGYRKLDNIRFVCVIEDKE